MAKTEYSSQTQILNYYKGFLTKSHPLLQQFSSCIKKTKQNKNMVLLLVLVSSKYLGLPQFDSSYSSRW